MPLDAAATTRVATQHPDPRCGSRWGVVHTHPQAERWAAQNLRRQGFDAYLPTHTVLRRDPVTRSITRQIEAPLFTSYLFVGIQSPHWAPIRHTLGVRSLLMSGLNPYLLPEAVWSALQAGEALRRTLTPPGTSWRPGAPCQPRDGPFQGLPAAVVQVDGQTAKIAIVMFGELRTVTISVECLVPRDA